MRKQKDPPFDYVVQDYERVISGSLETSENGYEYLNLIIEG